ncbi:hypothetical protein ACFYNZ_27145 [Streptomyces kebangsaanensis]|uniref:Uncharacterized protein n=1 Tax=Streptomyces kebangsaanensis TaxID=864058 RepID=A0ABW6L1N5_9ACTN
MTALSLHRPGRLVLVAVVALCVALAGGIGLWLYRGSDHRTDYCRKLSEDKRIHSALGSDHPNDSDCSRLGAAIRQATMGSKSGEHSVRQAQAMKNVLVALAEVTRNGDGRLDPALAVPVAGALADYMPDLYGVVSPGHMDYVRAFEETDPPWKDDTGVHVSVSSLSLLHVIRHLADTPEAYAELRAAVSAYAAAEFVAVPHGAEEWRFESPVRDAAYVLGAMDAVATDVRQDRGEGGWNEWSTDVFGQMAEAVPAPPAFTKDPARHISESWGQTLRAGGQKAMMSCFEAQSAEMVRMWGKGAGLDKEVQKSLLRVARDVSLLGRDETARNLP